MLKLIPPAEKIEEANGVMLDSFEHNHALKELHAADPQKPMPPSEDFQNGYLLGLKTMALINPDDGPPGQQG